MRGGPSPVRCDQKEIGWAEACVHRAAGPVEDAAAAHVPGARDPVPAAVAGALVRLVAAAHPRGERCFCNAAVADCGLLRPEPGWLVRAVIYSTNAEISR
jgi:hypothetical protein